MAAATATPSGAPSRLGWSVCGSHMLGRGTVRGRAFGAHSGGIASELPFFPAQHLARLLSALAGLALSGWSSRGFMPGQ